MVADIRLGAANQLAKSACLSPTTSADLRRRSLIYERASKQQ